MTLLQVDNLPSIPNLWRHGQAVRGVSFDVESGETSLLWVNPGAASR